MDVYNSVSSITDSGVPAYFKSLVNGADAKKAAGVAGVRASKSCTSMQAIGEPAEWPSDLVLG